MDTAERRRLPGVRGLAPSASVQIVAALLPGGFVIGLGLAVVLALVGTFR